MVNVRTSVAGGDGPAGQMDASPRDTNARAPMPTRVEAQIQSAIESLLLADSMLKGDQEDDDDPELRELRTRWMSERARLLDQQMRVDSLAREYSQRKARRVKQRETERQQQLFAMERRLRELHDEVNSLRGQQGSPNALPGAQHALVSRGSPSRYGASPQQASTDRFFAQQQQQHALTPPGAVRSASAAAATRAPAGSPGPYVASGLPPSFSPLAERADGDRRTPPRPGARGGVSELAKLRRELAHVKAEQSQYAPPVPAAAVGPVGVPSPADAAQQGNVARGSGAAAASAAMAAEPNGFGRARRGPGAVGGVDGSGGSSPCPPIAAPPTTEASAASASARRLLRSASGPGLLPEQQPSPHAQQQPPNQHAPNGSANGVGGGVPSSMRARQPTAVNRSGSGGPSQPGSRRTSNAGAAARVSPRAPELLVPRPPPPPALGPPAVVQRMEGRHTAAVTSVSPTDWEGCMLSAGGDGFVQLWERRQPHDGGADAGWAAGARLSCRAGNVNALAHVPGAHMVVAGCEDGTCRIFRLSGASDDDPRAGYSMYTLRSLKGHTGEVMALASLSWLVSGSQDGTVKTWDLQTGECAQTLSGHSSWVMAVAVGYADGSSGPESGAPCYLLSASGDGSAWLWVDAGPPPDKRAPPQFKRRAVLSGHGKALLAAELITSHGLAATGSDDKTIRLWSLSSHACVAVLDAHAAPVCAIVWHPARQQLLSSAEDAQLQLWQIALADGGGVSASAVATVPKPGGDGSDAMSSYALAVNAAGRGYQFCCGLDNGGLVVMQ